ncbi:transglutaminase-like domain-containing protein, partial [Balneolaceae bacterium ANBcel3]|nr:transglutaminase-like domain-containing protein [Balneolaceae bacterium ANBcel3]
METIARKATRKKSDLKRSEAKALFTLLEDPDPYIQKKVMERLSLLGEQSVPLLDEFREGLDDTEARKRISDLIHKLTFYSFENEFLEHLESGLDTCQKLERILLLLCRFDNPTLRTELSRIQLDKMADRLRHSLAGSDGITSTLALFSSYFFGQEYFRGATDDYMHPDNSYLHKVLQRRTGIPISLSLVMIFVARRLGIQVHGVNMPMHFLIRYEDEDDVVLMDPYNRGRVVTEDQCR